MIRPVDRSPLGAPAGNPTAAALRAQVAAVRAQREQLVAQIATLATVERTLEALVEQLEGSAAPAAPSALLTKQQLAAALAMSTGSIDRLCREGVLPFLTVGDSRRFDLAAVRAALEAREKDRKVPAAAPAAVDDRPASGVRLLTRGGRR